MINIGIVDPDTSHARHFVELLRKKPGVKVTGFLPKSGLRSKAVLDGYAEEFSLTQYANPNELTENVDAVLVLAADWRLHITIADFLVSRGIKVLIDKPIVGSIADLVKLVALDAKYPRMIFGGSALSYTAGVQQVHGLLQNHVANEITIYGPCDSTFLRIHSSEIAASLLTLDDTSTVLAEEDGLVIQGSNGARCRIRHHASPWKIELNIEAKSQTVEIPLEGIYDNYLECFVRFLNGSFQPDLNIPMDGVRIELAAKLSAIETGTIQLGEITESDVLDPTAFLDDYTKANHDVKL
jgi:hypothetical protein